MFQHRSLTVVIPAYNEEETIAEVVREFAGVECVDRVLVVNNRSADRTGEEARGAGAEVLDESRPGYGAAITAGLDHAFDHGAELAVITEADGSFAPEDVWKLLCYCDDAELVLGTRTTRQMVEQAGNMGRTLRIGNIVVAKLLEIFWFLPAEPRLTDVGCTLRALGPEAWRGMRAGLRESGPQFSPEMICEAYRRRMRVVEIPVHYRARKGGESKHSRSFLQVSRTALGMLRTICRKRFLG
jgi:UDP-N-acetylglucosamine diphosphorylase / glucose-1-phosphate thymidylyltransferase / UDP-N-acetylgalactosamine diphosphorylase / glucosamine-1-phosphate N-acetyltransferase / galactosamine-1-phosphate N-acetyltransferase